MITTYGSKLPTLVTQLPWIATLQALYCNKRSALLIFPQVFTEIGFLVINRKMGIV